MDYDKNVLIENAKNGNRDALEALVKSVQDRIYRLALKMLYQPSDAEDASQEILIKVITKLDSFRMESSFSTWALTIAANHLKNKQQNQKEKWFSFKRCEAAILHEIPDQSTLNNFKAEQNLIIEEMRIACMQGLLQCLDTNHRLTYILGTTMGLSSPQGAEVLGISPVAFRKRLSRSRESMRNFFTKNCDFFDEQNRCNCASQALSAVKKGYIKTENYKFADKPVSTNSISDVEAELARLDNMAREIAIMKINQDYQAPATFIQGIKQIFERK